MAPKYAPPSVEPILEASEDDESRDSYRDAGDEHTESARSDRRTSSQPHADMIDRSRRKPHKGASSVSSGRNGKSKVKVNSRPSRHLVESSSVSSSGRRRRRRAISRSPSSSSSSSSNEEEQIEDHHTVLAAARNKLTSPSALSTLTTLTTATNTSSGSSGSNSTITQASMSKSSSKQSSASSKSSAPSVPETPNVFSYMEQGQDQQPTEAIPLLSRPSYPAIPGSFSSSMTTLFNFSNSSEPANDQETDRSTSPDRSSQGTSISSPSSTTSKLDTQQQAAEDRQGNFSGAQTFAQPAPISTAQATFIPPPDTGPPIPPRQPPYSGYDLLATQLSSSAISPIYRRFSKLNHRVLLHLQDEITELQDRLQYLDDMDTHYRTIIDAELKAHIQPSSRRTGSALEWNRSDILNRLGYKLPQYNEALASFSKVSSASEIPNERDVEAYRTFFARENPLVIPEATFLSEKNDLVLLRGKDGSTNELPKESDINVPRGEWLRTHLSVVAAVSLHLLAWGYFTGTFVRLVIGSSMLMGVYTILRKNS